MAQEPSYCSTACVTTALCSLAFNMMDCMATYPRKKRSMERGRWGLAALTGGEHAPVVRGIEVESDIVDEAGAAQIGCGENHDLLGKQCDRPQGSGVAYGKIVRTETRCAQRVDGMLLKFGVIVEAAGNRFAAFLQYIVNGRRQGAFSGVEIAIARAQREAVGGARGVDADHFDRHAEIGHHLADDGQLLEILLAEQRHVRLHDLEKFGDDGRYTGEMAGAAGATQRF